MGDSFSRLLLVTYNFPPSGGVGVQRPLAICKYLRRLGHEVSVLTATMPVTHVYDADLQDRVPKGTIVIRAYNPEIPYAWRSVAKRFARALAKSPVHSGAARADNSPARRFVEWMAFPDPQKNWIPFAVRKASAAIRQLRIDTVIVTVPPFSGLGIGIEIKRRFPSVRLINDFRDEWIAYTLSEHRGGAGAYSVAKAIAMEREAVAAADFTIAVTESWLSLIRDRSTDQPREKFLCIPNGFDAEELPTRAPRTLLTEKFVICHAGTIDSTPVYSARRFFAAVSGLPPAVKDRLVVWLAGRIDRTEVDSMNASGVEVQRLGFLPHTRAMEKVAQADCALLLVNTRDAHSGKVFEYMALGVPILALTVPGGEIDRLLSVTGAGRSVDGHSIAAIRTTLETLVKARYSGTEIWPIPDVRAIKAYERSRLIEQMAAGTGIGRLRVDTSGDATPAQHRIS